MWVPRWHQGAGQGPEHPWVLWEQKPLVPFWGQGTHPWHQATPWWSGCHPPHPLGPSESLLMHKDPSGVAKTQRDRGHDTTWVLGGCWGRRDPQLCPSLPGGTMQRTLPRVPCVTAVTPGVPLVTPHLDSSQVGTCPGGPWLLGGFGCPGTRGELHGLCPPAEFPGEGMLHQATVGPLLVQDPEPWYEGEQPTPNFSPWPQTNPTIWCPKPPTWWEQGHPGPGSPGGSSLSSVPKPPLTLLSPQRRAAR